VKRKKREIPDERTEAKKVLKREKEKVEKSLGTKKTKENWRIISLLLFIIILLK